MLELAWTTGLIRWEDDPQPGWYDTESGELADEAELVERYQPRQRPGPCGIREFVDDGWIDPDHTVVRSVPDSSDWQVTRKAGTEIRVPRKAKLSRTVGDRVTLWNMVGTVDAFLSAGPR